MPSSDWSSDVCSSEDRKSTRLNSSHLGISYAVFCLLIRSRSEEHTSELQSLRHLVCRLLLGKKVRPRFVHEACRHGSAAATSRRPPRAELQPAAPLFFLRNRHPREPPFFPSRRPSG